MKQDNKIIIMTVGKLFKEDIMAIHFSNNENFKCITMGVPRDATNIFSKNFTKIELQDFIDKLQNMIKDDEKEGIRNNE